ncbi:SCO6745 family protein [Rhodococcus kronopolitis]|uniref:SalK n=1 Tax=Rhodococcus kronopolitis TaxID=1460226 RepID=A0ABV9FYA0_9NOCA
MDAPTAGRNAKMFEPIHSMSYFAPEVSEHLVAVGLEVGGMTYFAGRSAAMGAVAPSVVAATFYTFNPEVVAGYLPRAWELASPEAIVAARYAGAGAALRRLLGDAVVGSVEMAEAADIAAIAARATRPEGRPLFAAHAAVEQPAEPHLSLWHSLTLLREYRGDGHIVALQAAGLSGIEALITHTATGAGFTEKAALSRRGWSREQWDAASNDLRDRGLLADNGTLTELGTEIREVTEDVTDDLAFAPWAELGDAGLDRLTELLTPMRAAIVDAGTYPPNLFGPRWGKW